MSKDFKDLTEKEIEELKKDIKFKPFFQEYQYRKDNKEKTITDLENNIILFDHIEEKDIISDNGKDVNNHVFIESENLYALSALSQLSIEDKFDIVLIDPLYGTQSGAFRYNDEFIDKEASQGMLMWSMSIENRMRLARNLMKSDAVIMAFINYENCHLLRNCMDKVFGRENVLAQRAWKKKATPGNDTHGYLDHLDYICVYAYRKDNIKNKFQIPKSRRIKKRYKYYDSEGKYEITPFEKTGNAGDPRPSKYRILNPAGAECYPVKQWWRWGEKKYEEDKDKLVVWIWRRIGTKKWNHNLGIGTKTHALYTEEDLAKIGCKDIEWKPMVKSYYVKEDGANKMSTPSCILDLDKIKELIDDKGTLNVSGNKIASDLTGKNLSSMNPKPVGVIKKLIEEVNKKDVRVIDFYGGTATTLHAVIELNKEDGQKRICYYVQNEEGLDKKDNNRIIDDAHLRIKNLLKEVKDEIDTYNDSIIAGDAGGNLNSYKIIKDNVRYFKTKLLPINFFKISNGKKYEIFRKAYDTIKLINDSYTLIFEKDSYKIFASKGKSIIVINEKWDDTEKERKEIIDIIKDNNLQNMTAYEFSTSNECSLRDFFHKDKPVPHEIVNFQKRITKLF